MTRQTPSLSTAWRQALPLLLALIGWILFWYWDTAVAMANIWVRSETYTHAFVVPPISLWLIWRLRAQVLAEQPRASLLLAVPVIFTTFFWLLGELTAVNALTQFTLIATLVLAIMALLGIQVSKRIAFPLAFLFFAVPIGDFMMPKLMDWTAAFTVLALRATGIPVYQEGLQFVIPSGNWSVVEACSGIRYIIASVTVGTLFAYLNYVSLRRRLIFIGVAIIVPVVANWLRAYMIVMLGHLSGNKLAVGVDHLIYGWLFFGLVIMIMFMIGARWSEEPAEQAGAPETLAADAPLPVRNIWLTTVAIAFLAVVGPLAYFAISKFDPAAPVHLQQLKLPVEWQETQPFASWKPVYANPSAELQIAVARQGKPVGLYIAYYRNQDYQRKLVTSTNTLVVSNDSVWSVVARQRSASNLNGLPPNIQTAQLLGKDSNPASRLIVWQWYWINGKLTSSDIEAKLHTALSRLSGHGDDSAVIMLYAPLESASDTLPDFAAQAIAPINQLLDAARQAR